MTRIRVSTVIEVSPERVWGVIADIESQTRWMEDAVAIRITSAQRSGEGTAFDCETKIGPFRLVDRMQVTEWDPPRLLGIRHKGVVTGRGRFVIEPVGANTRFRWEEELAFPWWMAGAAGGAAATPLLARVWRRNLDTLKSLVEASSQV